MDEIQIYTHLYISVKFLKISENDPFFPWKTEDIFVVILISWSKNDLYLNRSSNLLFAYRKFEAF